LSWLQQFVTELREKQWVFPYREESGNDSDLRFNFLLEKWYEEDFHRGCDSFLDTVYKSPWWSRAWIRQEILRSADAYFLAANEFLHWSSVFKGIHNYGEASYGFEMPDYKNRPYYTKPPTFCSIDCHACLQMYEPREFRKFGRVGTRLLALKRWEFSDDKPCSIDLLKNLERMNDCEASDPRDLIYACIGISSHSYGIVPDYASDLSFEDVLVRTACKVIKMSKSLEILRLAYPTRLRSLDTSIPSWVPDWRNESEKWIGYEFQGPPRTTDFFAFYPDEQGRPNRILRVRGILTEIIDDKIDPWPSITGSLGEKVPIVAFYARPGDEIYLIHGFGNFLILRRQEGYHRLVVEVLGSEGMPPGVYSLLERLERMIEENDPAVVAVNIC
jgi:hypothetical protein